MLRPTKNSAPFAQRNRNLAQRAAHYCRAPRAFLEWPASESAAQPRQRNAGAIGTALFVAPSLPSWPTTFSPRPRHAAWHPKASSQNQKIGRPRCCLRFRCWGVGRAGPPKAAPARARRATIKPLLFGLGGWSPGVPESTQPSASRPAPGGDGALSETLRPLCCRSEMDSRSRGRGGASGLPWQWRGKR